jgi:hypothetical protein
MNTSPPAWALPLIVDQAVVLHTPTQTLGRVVGFRASTDECLVPVLVIDPGHEFLAEEGNFVRLSPSQSRFVEAAGVAMRHFTGECITLAASVALEAVPAMNLLASLLLAQSHTLRAAARATERPTDPAPPDGEPQTEREP